MIKFPNPSFRKFTYPKNHSLRLHSLHPTLSSQEYILYQSREEYNHDFNKNVIYSSK